MRLEIIMRDVVSPLLLIQTHTSSGQQCTLTHIEVKTIKHEPSQSQQQPPLAFCCWSSPPSVPFSLFRCVSCNAVELSCRNAQPEKRWQCLPFHHTESSCQVSDWLTGLFPLMRADGLWDLAHGMLSVRGTRQPCLVKNNGLLHPCQIGISPL